MLLYDFYTQQIRSCDEEIERLYGLTRPEWEAGEVQPMTKRKKNSHSKNLPQHPEEICKQVKQAECVFGVFYRRRRARLGPAQATVATAHAIARVVYRLLKYNVEYEPLNVNEYQREYEAQQVKYLKKKAARFGFLLVPI